MSGKIQKNRFKKGNTEDKYIVVDHDREIAERFYRVDSSWIHSKRNQRFYSNEVNALELLGENENIVKMLNKRTVDKNGMHFLVVSLEYIKMTSLNKIILSPCYKYTAKTVGEWLRQLFSAAAFLHQKQLVHRDIKPSNILVTDNFHLKITDFECCKSVDPAKTNTFDVGTIRYKPPESKGFNPINGRTLFTDSGDVFSIGITGWEIIMRSECILEESIDDSGSMMFINDVHRTPRLRCIREFEELITNSTSISHHLRPTALAAKSHLEEALKNNYFNSLKFEPDFDETLTKIHLPFDVKLIKSDGNDEESRESFTPPSVDF
ncbi:unnamed protein product, partial [Mesorhabditis belari]|uniref:Protein kinase domain-containing protein n=1 Tax=Mesorhabditis belari TaxID=2138241 RepID=A0AAF3F590_9BILA